MTRDQARATIEGLVTRFREHRGEYHTADYNETKTRIGFINPFFHALGWDVSHEEDRIESYREVIHEDKVRVKGQMKAPDYGFRVAGQGEKRLFFVEAKKPSVSLKTNREASYQLRIYGRSAQAPVSILTNFEEFIIYDCTKSPKQSDSASSARIKYIHFEDYIKEFDFIYDTFSHEAVYSGHFDKFVQSDTYKKGTQTLDKDFVESLDSWRKYLATSIALENKKLNEEEINFVVQQTIDRLIFLRFCEDRGVEQFAQLQKAVSHGNSYDNLYDLFKRADDKYNSGLFDFKKDTISAKLSINNKVLKKIIEDLYYPSPYVFRVMPIEVLGNAYEQFLGKVIRITSSHSARIEVKPEVRKAGGVYYTPQYIVEYIVKNTVGKLIEGKTPKEIEKIKIVDPACGSGSFLIGAFQYLVQYHVNWYHHHPAEAKRAKALAPPPSGEAGRGSGGLTTSEKKKILLNNIFGVDIDANAVEVTKLSLLLKCMEGETEASIKQQLSVFHERILPDLDNNIKDGNSLIDTDFLDEFNFGDDKKAKPFSWNKAFPNVFKQGGFDVVIGNPPYLKLTANNIEDEILSYYEKKYKSYSGGSSKNLFQLFLERVAHLKPKFFSFIIPEALLTTESNGKIREIILQNFNINSVVIFDHFVFEDATIGTTIVVGEKESKEKTKIVKIDNLKKQNLLQEIRLNTGIKPWDVSLDDSSKKFFKKIFNSSKLMGELVVMSKGMVVKDRNDILTRSPTKKSLPFLLGNCMTRYNYHYDKYAEYDKLDIIGGTRDLDKHISIPRLLIRRTGSNLCATYSEKQELIESTIYILRSEKINLKFLLGLLNSKLLSFYLSKRLITNAQGFPQVLMGQLEQLPVVTANEKNQNEIIRHVDLLLKLNEELKEEKLHNKIEQTKQHIAHSEEKINELVYELYELTPEEIKIVEEK
ncbi:MAG: methyltransferase [Bacteroidetes bacterium]|nr:MAG: methyltransferase [Bacteroidota bacterium]